MWSKFRIDLLHQLTYNMIIYIRKKCISYFRDCFSRNFVFLWPISYYIFLTYENNRK
jgi:hypothetical protein